MSRSAGTTGAADRMSVTVLEPRRGWQPVNWAELWRFRDLLWMLIVRDVKVRYKQTLLGVMWAVLQPAITVLVFTLLFGKMLGVAERVEKVDGAVVPYALFVLSAQILWQFFSNSVTQSSLSLVSNANMLRKVYFPRLLIPVSATGAPCVDAAIGAALLVVLMVYYGEPIEGQLLLFPLVALSVVAAALGVSIVLAALAVRYRDVKYTVPFMVQVWFFLTPVIWPVTEVSANYRMLLYLNPMAGPISAFRSTVLGMPVDYAGWALSAGISAAILAGALFYFARMERRFADVV